MGKTDNIIKASLKTNTTDHHQKESASFLLIDMEWQNSHAICIDDSSIYQVVSPNDDGGLLFYTSDKFGFNYAEDDALQIGSDSNYIDIDYDGQFSGIHVINGDVRNHFEGIKTFQEVKDYAKKVGISCD